MLDILLVDDEQSILLAFEEALRAEGHRVVTASDGLSAQAVLGSRTFDVVICDVRMPRVDGFSVFKRVRREAPGTRFILMTAYATVPDAVEALKHGASDYLAKPFELEDLLGLLSRIDRERELAQRFAAIRAAPPTGAGPGGELIGGSAPLCRLLDRVARFAASEAPVLITGEPGSGRGRVARLLHDQSSRRDRPFVSLNCAVLPEPLLEAELFGVPDDGGGAVRGRLALAEGGTLFLEEVAELPLGTQAKLLRLLQEQRFEPPGSGRTETADVRVVSATHGQLRELVAQRRFREDLYYRLKILELRVPALRERGGDLLALIDHLLRRLAHPSSPPSITARALAALAQYPFPGNVRELHQALQHAIVLSGGRQLDLPHLPPEISGEAAGPGPEAGGPRSLPEAVREFEREYIRRTVQRTHGNRTSAAALLGISRKNLWEKLRGFGFAEEDLDPLDPPARARKPPPLEEP